MLNLFWLSQTWSVALYRNSFSAMLCKEVCPYGYFRWCGCFRGPPVSLVTTDEFSLITLTSIIKVRITYSGGTDRPGNFSISNDLTQILNFPTRIPDCDSHSHALFDLFLLTLVFSLQWHSLHLEIMMILILSQFFCFC